ncbi:MAG TPA: serine hydrolase domain-containing protein, partial [Pyrinomonadaceae bacterium]|nr:serine hydrolase domain-containing protein [Pyrinomonadaceae bacterium]
LFAIASNSKAFTAACLAILVDEKKTAWDDKVIKYLPDLEMYDPWVTKELTIRDVVSHRVGLDTFSGDLLRFAPAPNFVADLEHWQNDTFRVKWRPSVAYNFPRGFVTFTIEKGRTGDLKIDQPNSDFWFYELTPKRVDRP